MIHYSLRLTQLFFGINSCFSIPSNSGSRVVKHEQDRQLGYQKIISEADVITPKFSILYASPVTTAIACFQIFINHTSLGYSRVFVTRNSAILWDEVPISAFL